MGPNDLEKTVKKLKDLEEIKKLHADYAYLIDSGRMGDVVELFAEDAVADWGKTRGIYRGKREIAAFFEDRIPKATRMLRHMMMQPDIEIDGDRARAKWYMFGFGTYILPEGETAAWTHGKYENELVREAGRWKFKYLRFEFTFQTPYHEGWVKKPSLVPTEFENK